jgi:hypothetical protein
MRRLQIGRGRSRLVERIQESLQRRSYPRTQMALLVTMTGCLGFLASYGLLQLGLDTIWLRYLAALCVAYLGFLGLLRAWIRYRTTDLGSLEVDPSAFDVPGDAPASFQGGGGSFGGAGASGAYEPPASDVAAAGSKLPGGSELPGGRGSGGGSSALGIDLDDLWVPLIVVAATVAGLALLSGWVVYSAPALFAELLLDGALAASLYGRVRGIERRHWLQSALRRTCVPFALMALLICGAGWAMSQYAPHARSVGEVFVTWKVASRDPKPLR